MGVGNALRRMRGRMSLGRLLVLGRRSLVRLMRGLRRMLLVLLRRLAGGRSGMFFLLFLLRKRWDGESRN
jgi:hypothetical protein